MAVFPIDKQADRIIRQIVWIYDRCMTDLQYTGQLQAINSDQSFVNAGFVYFNIINC